MANIIKEVKNTNKQTKQPKYQHLYYTFFIAKSTNVTYTILYFVPISLCLHCHHLSIIISLLAYSINFLNDLITALVTTPHPKLFVT